MQIFILAAAFVADLLADLAKATKERDKLLNERRQFKGEDYYCMVTVRDVQYAPWIRYWYLLRVCSYQTPNLSRPGLGFCSLHMTQTWGQMDLGSYALQ